MILENIKIYLQNIWKNNFIINTILETHSSFNIIFIQEPFWSIICSILSSTSCKEKELVGVLNYSNWTTFSRNPIQAGDSLKVLTYINICIYFLCFFLQNDIFNHKNISCISFFNSGSIFFLINVYSDLSQVDLKYLKDTKVNISNVLIITGDFNIRNSFWDSNFLYHSIHRDTLFNIADSFGLELSKPFESFPTRYSSNHQDSDSVLDLVFLYPNSSEHNNHHIRSD